MGPQPIPTSYQGYRFRSRLEARWAVYWDSLGLQWWYEPQGYDLGFGIRYLPDFWLPEVQSFAEVKPGDLDRESARKIKLLVEQTHYPCVLLSGPPAYQPYLCVFPSVQKKGDRMIFSGTDSTYAGNVVLSKALNVPDDDYPFFWVTGCTGAKEFTRHYGDGWNDSDVFQDALEAAIAARSARFEHGEAGRR